MVETERSHQCHKAFYGKVGDRDEVEEKLRLAYRFLLL